jgi:hypothetical protein
MTGIGEPSQMENCEASQMEICDGIPAVDLMIDSGAFSAFMKGEKVNLADDIAFLKANSQWIRTYVSLDVIPGSPEHPPTDRERELAAIRSHANQQEMKAHGLTPLPVFHQGEAIYWLERMLRDGERYICISPREQSRRTEQRRWMDKAFAVLKGTGVKTHGLGVTRPDFMQRYPWTSVDSSTWSKSAGYGRILVPKGNGWGGFDYGTDPFVQKIGDLSPNNDFAHMGPTVRNHLVAFAKQAGVEGRDVSVLARLGCDSESRRRLWLHYFLEFQKVHPIKIVFATGPQQREFSALLTAMGCQNRLLSYFYLKDVPEDYLAHYVPTGLEPRKAIVRVKKKLSIRERFDNESYLRKRAIRIAEMVESENPDGA